MSVDLDGTANSWQDNTQSVITNYPFTLMAWIQISTSGLGKFLGAIADISSGQRYMWWGQNADDTLRYTSRFTTSYHAYTTNTMSVNTWHHACVIGTSATDRRVILDGDWANSGTNTTESVMTGIDSFQIASQESSTAPSTNNTWQGKVQDYTVWNVALTQAEVEALAAGASPRLVRPQSLVGYWPLTKDDNPPKDVMGSGINLTRNTTWNATTAPSRPILQPTAQIIPFASARGKVWVNDAPTKDGGEVLQGYPGTWTDTTLTLNQVIDQTGLSGQIYVGVETASGQIAWRAITISSGSYTIYNNYYRQLLAGNV